MQARKRVKEIKDSRQQEESAQVDEVQTFGNINSNSQTLDVNSMRQS